jgi:phosphatidylinositol alpha-mannosyltransferase
VGRQRIALISSSYFPHAGGVEEHVRHLARELTARGHAVAVWTVDRGEHLGTRTVDGVEVRYLPAPLPARSGRALVAYAVRLPSAWRAWMRAYRDLGPDLLHVQCFGPNGLYALALHHRTRTPLVVSSHGETFMDDHDAFGSSALLRRGLRRSLVDATVVTGCSTAVLDDLRRRFGLGGGQVVPNGIDLDEVVEPVEPGWWPGSGPVVLALGRVEDKKGFDLLLRAFAQIVGAGRVSPSARLVIGGDGSALAGLRALAAELGVADAVVLPGRLSREEVAGAISRANVFVVPSRIEAFGIVALEAWRGGAPLVMTCHGGARDFVTDGVDGLLVDPEDVVALASAVARVLEDPELGRRLAEAGATAVLGHTWADVADRYDQVLTGKLG